MKTAVFYHRPDSLQTICVPFHRYRNIILQMKRMNTKLIKLHGDVGGGCSFDRDASSRVDFRSCQLFLCSLNVLISSSFI